MSNSLFYVYGLSLALVLIVVGMALLVSPSTYLKFGLRVGRLMRVARPGLEVKVKRGPHAGFVLPGLAALALGIFFSLAQRFRSVSYAPLNCDRNPQQFSSAFGFLNDLAARHRRRLLKSWLSRHETKRRGVFGGRGGRAKPSR